MRKRIKHYLNRRFPDFLSCKEGIIYFILLIPILSITLILLQPLGLNNWHEFHKNIVVIFYCITILGTYPVVYIVINSLLPHYFNPACWTIGKQIKLLFTIYLPVEVCFTLFFMHYCVEEFELNSESFFRLLLYNSIIGAYTAPTFGYFISNKLRHITVAKKVVVEEIIEKEDEKDIETIQVYPKTEQHSELPAEIVINNIPMVVNDISFIESNVNNLHFRVLHNGITKEIITRYTLKKLERDLKEYSQFIRCQNSFIVNMHHLKDWDIVDEKMIIHPKYCTVDITVRRNISEKIKEILLKNYIFRAK
jgi:hypothetical protein